MRKKRVFIQLAESYMRRHQRGGFLVGDVIVIKKNFKSLPSFKVLNPTTQQAIISMIDSGLNIRVVNIKDAQPGARFPANPDTAGAEVVLDIAVDEGGGRYGQRVTVPADIGDPDQDIYPNLPPVPDAWKREDRVNVKPKEFEEDRENLSNKTDRGDGKLKYTERQTATKNKTIPSKPAKSTADYMKGVK